MKVTDEQQQIINSTGDIKVNAVAGSGKTTTLVEYARKRPDKKILYLVFNKSVKLEAIAKFEKNQIDNVKVETAHSLAYKRIVGNKYKLVSSYKPSEIVDILKLLPVAGVHSEYVIANHINRFVSYFCNSTALKLSELEYTSVLTEKKAKIFANTFYAYIYENTRLFLAKMDRGEIPIIHDFYLKKYQLSNPILNYDCILFDEGQDASPVMLDVFLKQKATKVIVGDSYQQIYGWRYAINSLMNTEFQPFELTQSFRFRQDIANLGKKILHQKKYLELPNDAKIFGKGNCTDKISKATISRSNVGLLIRAIEYVDKSPSNKIHFEGGFQSYTYAEEGTSLYDVLNLSNGKRDKIRDTLLKKMKDTEELERYIEQTSDAQLAMLQQIVKLYGNQIYSYIHDFKNLETEDRNEAKMIFSTVHKAKGMEYDMVTLNSDFLNEQDLVKKIVEYKTQEIDYVQKLNEEINLLYVAITRTKNKLVIPKELLPADIESSKSIMVWDKKF